MINLHLYIENAINGYRLTFWDNVKPTIKLNTVTYLDALNETLAIIQKLKVDEGLRLRDIVEHQS